MLAAQCGQSGSCMPWAVPVLVKWLMHVSLSWQRLTVGQKHRAVCALLLPASRATLMRAGCLLPLPVQGWALDSSTPSALGLYRLRPLPAVNQTADKPYYLFDGYAHLGAGLACGLSGLGAGMAIGIVGDAGVR